MTFRKTVKRGEIYYYDFGTNEGSIQNGCRPVLIVQCDEGNQASETTVVAAITTSKKRYLPTHISLDESCGLREPSIVFDGAATHRQYRRPAGLCRGYYR